MSPPGARRRRARAPSCARARARALAGPRDARRAPPRARRAPSGRGPTRAEIASYLEENALLLEAILEKQNTGRLHEAVHYQLQLQQNLIYLATHADERDDIQPLNFQPTHAAGGAAPRRRSRPRALRDDARRWAVIQSTPLANSSTNYHILRRALF